MKKLLLLALLLTPVAAQAEPQAHMGKAHNMADRRISLGLSPEMKQHQLVNMRAHLAAVQKITGFLAEKKYDKAANIARTQLGLTEEMKQMCDMFENAEFKALGMAFHNSGDELADVLKTKNPRKIFKALNKTLGYCVQCHEKFQQ
ncbi:MAG: cytochrome C [Gallionellaceae bacterium]|nr:cytochrome C [Gallionellaceae bacterium]